MVNCCQSKGESFTVSQFLRKCFLSPPSLSVCVWCCVFVCVYVHMDTHIQSCDNIVMKCLLLVHEPAVKKYTSELSQSFKFLENISTFPNNTAMKICVQQVTRHVCTFSMNMGARNLFYYIIHYTHFFTQAFISELSQKKK